MAGSTQLSFQSVGRLDHAQNRVLSGKGLPRAEKNFRLGNEIPDRPTATELAFDDGGPVVLVRLAIRRVGREVFSRTHAHNA